MDWAQHGADYRLGSSSGRAHLWSMVISTVSTQPDSSTLPKTARLSPRLATHRQFLTQSKYSASAHEPAKSPAFRGFFRHSSIYSLSRFSQAFSKACFGSRVFSSCFSNSAYEFSRRKRLV
eukprot:COSAG06_NODE_1996_length_7886_cov_6.036985_11_plen_121_part_00